MELIVKSFSLLNLKNNEIYLSLLQNRNYILNRKPRNYILNRGLPFCQGPVHTLINKYQEFYVTLKESLVVH